MKSHVTSFRKKYGKFTEILPEELNSTTANQLSNLQKQLTDNLEKDWKNLECKTKSKFNKIKFKNFENNSYLIKKTFLIENESLNKNPEKLRFCLSKLSIIKKILKYLSEEITSYPVEVQNNFQNYSKLSLDNRKKRISLINFTRTYQELIGYAVNICGLLEEYNQWYDYAFKLLDPDFKIQHSSSLAHIYDFELIHGAKEILLRGNVGRFTSPPLIRSALEVMLTRKILNTQNSIKYKNKQIIYSKDFRFVDFLSTVEKTGSKITIGSESARRIFNWGSVSVHRAYRKLHSDMWFALALISSIDDQILKKKEGKTLGEITDKIFEELMKENQIKLK